MVVGAPDVLPSHPLWLQSLLTVGMIVLIMMCAKGGEKRLLLLFEKYIFILRAAFGCAALHVQPCFEGSLSSSILISASFGNPPFVLWFCRLPQLPHISQLFLTIRSS